MEFQLVLVRHGYSLGNEKSLFSGWSDVPVSYTHLTLPTT